MAQKMCEEEMREKWRRKKNSTSKNHRKRNCAYPTHSIHYIIISYSLKCVHWWFDRDWLKQAEQKQVKLCIKYVSTFALLSFSGSNSFWFKCQNMVLCITLRALPRALNISLFLRMNEWISNTVAIEPTALAPNYKNIKIRRMLNENESLSSKCWMLMGFV